MLGTTLGKVELSFTRTKGCWVMAKRGLNRFSSIAATDVAEVVVSRSARSSSPSPTLDSSMAVLKDFCCQRISPPNISLPPLLVFGRRNAGRSNIDRRPLSLALRIFRIGLVLKTGGGSSGQQKVADTSRQGGHGLARGTSPEGIVGRSGSSKNEVGNEGGAYRRHCFCHSLSGEDPKRMSFGRQGTPSEKSPIVSSRNPHNYRLHVDCHPQGDGGRSSAVLFVSSREYSVASTARRLVDEPMIVMFQSRCFG